MSNEQRITGVGLHTSIQIGTLVAALSVVAYVLAPIRGSIEQLGASLGVHVREEGHAGVLAQLASFRTDLAAVRAEIAGTDRLNSVQDRAVNDRLDYFRGALAGLLEKSSNIEQRVSRMEALVMVLHGDSGGSRSSGWDQHDLNEGVMPHGIPSRRSPCYSTCHGMTKSSPAIPEHPPIPGVN